MSPRLRRLRDLGLDELVEAARGGDRPAFDELVRRTHQETFTLALRLLSDPDDARDVTQETYLRAYRSLDGFRGDANFRTWLYRITANCSSTHLRRRFRHRHEMLTEEMWAPDEDVRHDPEARGDAGGLRDELARSIGGLPPRLRAAVVLHDVYGLSHAEIATELSITESAAKVRLHRARRRLREELTPFVGTRPQAGNQDHRSARAV